MLDKNKKTTMSAPLDMYSSYIEDPVIRNSSIKSSGSINDLTCYTSVILEYFLSFFCSFTLESFLKEHNSCSSSGLSISLRWHRSGKQLLLVFYSQMAEAFSLGNR